MLALLWYLPCVASIGLFIPCYLATLRPTDTGHALHVLEALGDHVTVIDGRCCGQPAFNSGFREEAHDVGRGLLKEAQPFATIVTPSGSCTTMVRHYLPTVFPGERGVGAQSIGNRFEELTSYVANHPNFDQLTLRLPGTVTYHDACHYRRELKLTDTAIGLLERIEGLELRRLTYEEECCGFGGSFSVKLPDVSVAMMTAKLGDIAETRAGVVVSADYSCLAHLESGARGVGMGIETWTMTELLSRALQ